MLKTKIITLTILLLEGIAINAQEPLRTNSDTHIFWQPTKPLEAKDFQGDINANQKFVMYCDSIEMCTMAYVGLFSVLDVPKKKKDRGKKLERVYFAPAFEIKTSYTILNDSIGLARQQLLFDVYELSARIARKNLKKLEDSIGEVAYGIRYFYFKSIEAEAIEFRDRLVSGMSQDFYIHKREGALLEWKDVVSKMMEDSKEFATTPEDCYRFVMNKPIEEGYIMSEEVAGPMKK